MEKEDSIEAEENEEQNTERSMNDLSSSDDLEQDFPSNNANINENDEDSGEHLREENENDYGRKEVLPVL